MNGFCLNIIPAWTTLVEDNIAFLLPALKIDQSSGTLIMTGYLTCFSGMPF
jgi:hypothetical protein